MAVTLGMLSVPFIAISITVYFISLCAYRLYFDPLAKFPGPKLAAISRWYEAYYDLIQNGQYTFKIAELHQKYGPIIRISPYELHINDPSYYEKLYRQDGRWNKYGWAYDGFVIPQATIATLGHDMHRLRRAPLGPYFSKVNVAKRQTLITSHVSKLRSRLQNSVESKKPFDFDAALSALTTDVATEFILGESYNNLDREDYNAPMATMIQGGGAMWRLAKHIPPLGPLMKMMPLSMLEKSGNPKVVSFVKFLRTSSATVKQLIANFSDRKQELDSPPTLVDAILEASSLPESEKSFQRINDDIDTITGAGFETTAGTLRYLVFHIYKNPAILNRLRAEIRQHTHNVPPDEHLPLNEIEHIPYLTAVIMEGFRLGPGVVSRLARNAPDRDLVYADKWTIPAGTPVGMTAFHMHRDPSVYKDALTFNPDRWADLEKKGDVWKTLAPFSRGTRICLGMHLAWAELYFTLTMLVDNFDFDLLDTSADDVEIGSDQFIAGMKGTKGVKAVALSCPREG